MPCQFLLFNKKSRKSANELVKKAIHMKNIPKTLPLRPSEPEIKNSKDRYDRRSQRLQAERDFDRDLK